MTNAEQGIDAPGLPPAGTASLLTHYAQYVALERGYSSAVAFGLLQKALERQGVQQSVDAVQNLAVVNNAIVTKSVDLAQEVAQAAAQANAIVEDLLCPQPVSHE